MDITSEDFVNKNLYEFCHAEDLQKLHKAHVDCEYRSSNRHPYGKISPKIYGGKRKCHLSDDY